MSHGPLLDRLQAWVRTQQPALDEAIATAAIRFLPDYLRLPFGPFDLAASTAESYRLSRGEDLCYDRPSTGVTYGLWYHARRVNTCLRQVLPSLADAPAGRLVVYDLGAGTGAFQWAFALGAAALRAAGKAAPELHVVNVDSSPVMLHYMELLWKALAERAPEVTSGVTYERAVNAWTSTDVGGAEGWLCASYLFDHSDKAEDLSHDFDALLGEYRPGRVLLSTSARKGHAYLDRIAEGLRKRDYNRVQLPESPCFSGPLPRVNQLRRALSDKGYTGIRPNASWDDPSYAAATFARPQLTLGMGGDKAWEEVTLFRPELPKRRDVVLTPEQKKAARLTGRPTILYGAAGSGKSIVLTERLRLLAEQHDYAHDLRVLVTTFNKELISKVLKPWVSQLLDRSRYELAPTRRGGATFEYHFRDRGGSRSSLPNISLMHFDVLPTRLGEVHKIEELGGYRVAGDDSDEEYEEAVNRLIEEAIDRVTASLSDQGIAPSAVRHVLDPRYVYDELHRIVYGREAIDEEEYLEISRPGRPQLNRGSTPRRVLWQVLEAYRQLCHERRVRTFLHRRIHLLKLIREGRHPGRFTHVYVDEMQDCTPADFEIFYGLLDDPNNLFLTGDLAQAVHMGRTASTRVPRMNGDQRYFRNLTLTGSFRLPFRISEALIPLSERIRDKRKNCRDAVEAALQHPFKGSPPGVRPIIVAAGSEGEMAAKLLAVARAYGEPSLGDVGFKIGEGPLIMEHDAGLRNAIKAQGGKAWADTILRVKGLEAPWVVWSTRAEIPADEDVEEYVYTILTRGAGVLTIALFPEPGDACCAVLNTFDPDRVICWDRASAEAFNRARRDRPINADVEPHPDFEPADEAT